MVFFLYRCSVVLTTSEVGRGQHGDTVRQRHVELMEQHQHVSPAARPRDHGRPQQVADSPLQDHARDIRSGTDRPGLRVS